MQQIDNALNDINGLDNISETKKPDSEKTEDLAIYAKNARIAARRVYASLKYFDYESSQWFWARSLADSIEGYANALENLVRDQRLAIKVSR